MAAKLLRMRERALDNPAASLLWNMLLGSSKQDLLQGKIRRQAGQMDRQTCTARAWGRETRHLWVHLAAVP